MHIVIDACCLGRKKTGNETYIRGLLSGFESLISSSQTPSSESQIFSLSDFQRFKFTVLTTSAYQGERAACFDWINIPLGNFLTRNFVTIPSVLKRVNPDLYHGVYWSRFFALPVPTILTIHDLSFVGFPQGFHRHEQLVYANLIRLCAWSAKHILTISESSKREMMRYWNIPAVKITVAYLAQDDCYQLLESPAEAKEEDSDGDVPYILYVGNLHPRKNIVRLLAAFVQLKQLGLPHKLKIVGQATWMAGDVFSAVRDSGFTDEVEFTGYISYETMVSVYQRAAVFVYPSLYEGFGLPILEAMACGCPVVCSNVTSVPEVAADAAILVNPESVDEIAAGIRRVLTEPRLAESLRERGIAQAKKFTWQACAEETLAAYQVACADGGKKWKADGG